MNRGKTTPVGTRIAKMEKQEAGTHSGKQFKQPQIQEEGSG